MIVYKCAECGREFTHRPLWPLTDGGKKAKHSTGLSEKAETDEVRHISPARCYCSEKCRFDAKEKQTKAREQKQYQRVLKQIDASPKDYYRTKKLCIFGGFVAAHRWYAGKYFTACAVDCMVSIIITSLILGQPTMELIILALLDIALWVTDFLNIRRGKFRDGKKHPIWPKN